MALIIGISLLFTAAAAGPGATEPTPETVQVAEAAGVDSWDLQGAVNVTGLPADQYLEVVGELAAPVVDARVACIESKESGGANVANRQGSGAVGVLQFMPRTFSAHAAEMGHFDWSPWTPWQARLVAQHDLALGRRRQWTVTGCP
jgi:hypothetical protein